jgi:hypothetical protein
LAATRAIMAPATRAVRRGERWGCGSVYVVGLTLSNSF